MPAKEWLNQNVNSVLKSKLCEWQPDENFQIFAQQQKQQNLNKHTWSVMTPVSMCAVSIFLVVHKRCIFIIDKFQRSMLRRIQQKVNYLCL
jgi:hypothetical protein